MDKNLIEIRRGEVDREIERLQARLDALTNERRELDIAEKVFDRLSGAKRGSLGEANESKPSPASGFAEKKHPTVRQMITEALMDARQRALPGRSPQQIREYIMATYEVQIGQQINTTASRMWHDLKEIEKDVDSGLFRLPQINKSEKRVLANDFSDLLEPEQQGREAGPGGGT